MPTFEVRPDIINTNKININIDENGLEWLSQPSNTGYVNAPPKLLERFYYTRELLKTRVISVKPKLDTQLLVTAITMEFPNSLDKDTFYRKAKSSGNLVVNLLKGLEPYGWKVKSKSDNEYNTSVYKPVAYINFGTDIGPFTPIVASSIYSFIIENLYTVEDENNVLTTFSNLSTPNGSINRRITRNAAANTGNNRRAPLPASGPPSVQSLPSSTQSVASVPSLPKKSRKSRKSRFNR